MVGTGGVMAPSASFKPDFIYDRYNAVQHGCAHARRAGLRFRCCSR